MKTYLKKLTALLLTLLLALSLAACGGTDDDDDDTGLADFTPMTVEELTGGWVDDDGNQLVIDPDTSTYDYRTWYGRVGFGPFEVVDDRPVIEYDGFYYDFEADGDADRYADLDNAEFYASDGHLRYYDGENIFFLPDTYAVAADGLAYDGAGNVYAAGWDMTYYDPADDWGDNWASNWG